MEKNEWFASWFDTNYYHLLYKDRDLLEAKKFVNRLVDELNIPAGSTALDLACGKGRHALTLSEKGLKVLGVDLSEQSIASASKLKNELLDFQVHDMRHVIKDNNFDYIFNLFTSFGYFEDESENLKVLHCIHHMLEPEGIFVFDFLNLETTLASLVAEEKKTIEGVEFHIQKDFDGKYIRKSIDIRNKSEIRHFEEKVRAYSFQALCDMMEKADFEILKSYGNFQLHHFNEKTADRVILICKRNKA
jgi:ubiquinone/menaquinone biosynthesis C-methylase UbiE